MKIRKVNVFSIIICFILLLINLSSIIYAIVKQLEINFFDWISIVVAVILGISTIIQTEQENRTNIQTLDIDIKSHTPFFIIKSMVQNVDKIDGYKKIDAQRFDTSIYDSTLYKEEKNFALVGYKENGDILIDFSLKNASDILVSSLSFFVYDYDKKVWKNNQYVNPVVDTNNKTIKENLNNVYIDLDYSHYNELFTNDYSNLEKDKTFVVHMKMNKCNLNYDITKFIENKQTPETLFFKFKMKALSIYGEAYEQEFDIGMRLYFVLIKKNKDGKNDYGFSIYDSWFIYELRKINSSVSIEK